MMYAETVIARHLGRRLFVDTNLLLLYLVGTFQRERVLTFKRTSQFTLAQFDFLVALIGRFEKVATTPHVLTEVNGLANALPEIRNGHGVNSLLLPLTRNSRFTIQLA